MKQDQGEDKHWKMPKTQIIEIPSLEVMARNRESINMKKVMQSSEREWEWKKSVKLSCWFPLDQNIHRVYDILYVVDTNIVCYRRDGLDAICWNAAL